MLRPARRWSAVPHVPVTPELADTASRLGVSAFLVRILAARGIATPEALTAFVGEPLAALHDPALLPDAGVLQARIVAARERGERVMVFGDFDADGLTALAVMTLALRALGIAVEPYVPSRLAEGHGLSLAAVDHAAETGCRVIVTVDCGTSSPDEIAAARARGIDVLVTDHHHVPDRDPGALALVNPHRPGSAYPEPVLTGAGVAFKVAQLLLEDGSAAGHARWIALADLATIGTVADVAPLLGENRGIVRLGLEQIRAGSRPSLAALLARAGLPAARVTADAIAFTLAPRLNAAGRIGDVELAARLLLTDDPVQADELAGRLEEANGTRRELTGVALGEARAALGTPAEDDPAVIVSGAWPVGLVGLVAAKLAEDHGRPAVVFSTLAEPWRGSARTPWHGFDLARAFGACERHFVRYGGHADAAGCDMDGAQFEAFAAAFRALAAEGSGERHDVALRVDAAVPAAEIGYALYRDLAMLEPTGAANLAPHVAVLDATVRRARAVSSGHAQLTIAKGRGEVLDVIAFGRGELAGQIREGDRLDIVARLASRTFGGFETLQLELLDAGSGGTWHAAATRPAAGPARDAAAEGPAELGGRSRGESVLSPAPTVLRP